MKRRAFSRCRHFALLAAGVALFAPAMASAQFLSPASTVYADQMEGANVGEKVNAALRKLGGRHGAVVVEEGGEIATGIVLGVGQSLYFGPGKWHCTANPCITLNSGSDLIGSGVYKTRIERAPGTAGPIVRSKDYERLSAMSEKDALAQDNSLAFDRKNLPGIKFARIRDISFDGRREDQTEPANGIELYGLWLTVEEVSIERFNGDGLVTQFIAGGDIEKDSTDAMESNFTKVKLLGNKGNGWTVRGPHDSISTNVISALNDGWGIDVQHKEGHYSGGGLMLTNTHLYANGDGMRTEPGAAILAFGLVSEANVGVGLLLRSNDSVIVGSFYANGGYGIQFGDDEHYAGANTLTVQLHNNGKAQVHWKRSGGYNVFTGTVYPNDSTQKFFESLPALSDQVLTAGPHAVQQFSGGLSMDSDGNIYRARLVNPEPQAQK
jgi:hypothetical protein